MPALASAFLEAGAGPVSMIVGSAPETAVARIRARGVRPSSLAGLLVADRDQRGAVDDARELPGVWTWSIFSTQWYFCSATASKPPISPIAANEGLSLPSVSTVVPGRMNSSLSRTTFSLRSLTGTTELSKLAASPGRPAARSCERAA